jgi:hypothetical protein
VAYIISTRIGRCVGGGDSLLEHARRLFQEFHSFAAPHVIRSECRRSVPDVLVKLGELRGLIYSSDKAQCGRPRTFVHFMESRPMLASDPSGRQLYILGGNYHVTARGIEG